MLIDEADAIAQSRELDQMHHEDRAGVNALIRGIDSFTRESLPVLIVMCTNRLESIDPAVKRRATGIFEFTRPSEGQIILLLQTHLQGSGISDLDIKKIAQMMGESESGRFGYTYSDIIQNVLPAVVLAAFPNLPVTYQLFAKVLKEKEELSIKPSS